MENDNLLKLLEMFKSKPHHLFHFLMENNAFSDDFLKKVENNEILNNIDDEDIEGGIHFNSISEMRNYYNSLVDNLKKFEDYEDLSSLMIRLDEAVKSENYEEASSLRDYIRKIKLKK